MQRVQAQGHRTTRMAISMTSAIALSLIVVGFAAATEGSNEYRHEQRHHLVDGNLLHTSTDKKEQSFATDEHVIQTDHDRGETDLIITLRAGGEPRADVQPIGSVPNRPRGGLDMTLSEEQNTKMKKAITQAIKVMGDRFGSTEGDVARSIQELKASMQTPVATPVTIQE